MVSEKACPIVVRRRDGHMAILAFEHPSAGKQFVKGTIESGEPPRLAAERELREESGLTLPSGAFLGRHEIGPEHTLWHFYLFVSNGLPDTWQHQTEDDEGHVFEFFWHPIGQPLDDHWHPIFHEAFAFFAPRLALSSQTLPSSPAAR